MLDRRACLVALAALPVAGLAGRGHAQAADIHAPDGLAIGGMDAVSYFEGDAPRPGSAGLALIWRGAEWRFASEAAREAFEMRPAAYAPSFGGYCAWSMAQGVLASGDPWVWSVHQGRLYLMHDAAARRLWLGDVAAHVARAEAAWPAVLQG